MPTQSRNHQLLARASGRRSAQEHGPVRHKPGNAQGTRVTVTHHEASMRPGRCWRSQLRGSLGLTVQVRNFRSAQGTEASIRPRTTQVCRHCGVMARPATVQRAGARGRSSMLTCIRGFFQVKQHWMPLRARDQFVTHTTCEGQNAAEPYRFCGAGFASRMRIHPADKHARETRANARVSRCTAPNASYHAEHADTAELCHADAGASHSTARTFAENDEIPRPSE